MPKSMSIFCLLATQLCFIPIVSANEYYVIAQDGKPCPEGISTICQPLDFYNDTFFMSNTIFYFLPGIHLLRENKTLAFHNILNLTLQGLGEMQQGFHELVMESTSVIKCAGPNSGVAIFLSQNIKLASLTFTNCGSAPLSHSEFIFYIFHYFSILSSASLQLTCNASVFISESVGILLEQVSIQNGSGYGLAVINGYNLVINQSSFSQNNLNAYFQNQIQEGCGGGNMLLYYTNPSSSFSPQFCAYFLFVQCDIQNSNVSFGTNVGNPMTHLIPSGGISFIVEQSEYGILIALQDVRMIGNTGVFGANFYFLAFNVRTVYSISMNNLVSMYGNWIYPYPQNSPFYDDLAASGFYFVGGPYNSIVQDVCDYREFDPIDVIIRIVNSQFEHNFGGTQGGGMFLSYYQTTLQFFEPVHTIVIKNSSFSDNIGYNGMGIFITSQISNTLSVVFEDVLIKDCYTVSEIQPLNSSVALSILFVRNVTASGLEIIDNVGGGMSLIECTFTFHGKYSTIRNNTRILGGGITIQGISIILFQAPTMVEIVENHADLYGGGIFVQDIGFSEVVCTFGSLIDDSGSFSNTSIVNLSYNTAGVSGSGLYGGLIDNCLPIVGSRTFDEIFSVSGESYSLISSRAIHVCFCNESKPDCNLQQMNFTAFPGEEISIPFVTVGQRYGISPGSIKLTEIVNEVVVHETINDTQAKCDSFPYKITLKDRTESNMTATLKMAVYKIFDTSLDSQKTLSLIDIKVCPLGFELLLIQKEFECGCRKEITQLIQTAVCNITSQEIQRRGDVWIGYRADSSCLILQNNCPFDYCNDDIVVFQITDPDPQCALNRSGIMCGECADGLSLLLGSNQCGMCSNNYHLAIIIPIAVAGLVLVILLIALNLTVSVGTINGLIFCANIVKINESIFFPNGPILVLSQFISWLNLDLGIQTCFYDGLDSYVKSWLQFIFPFYIWLLIACVITAAYHSGQVSKLVGNNAVPVLATLIFLSYTKLLRTVLFGLYYTHITCENITEQKWFIDPNIGYLSTKHAILFTFVLAVLIILVIPYTVILLFIPILQGPLSGRKCCRFLLKLAGPFFDAYSGPYEDRYRFWPGILLLARVALVLTSSFGDSPDTILSITATIIALILSVTTSLRGVYQKWYLNFLDTWFMLILAFMVALAAGEKAELGTIIGVSISFVSFLAILVYHGVIRLKSISKIIHLAQKIRSRVAREEDISDEEPLLQPVVDYEDDDIRERATGCQSVELVFKNLDGDTYDKCEDDEGVFYLRPV